MKIASPRRRGRFLSWFAALVLFAAGCTASTTVDQSTEASPTEPVASQPAQGDDDSTTTAPADTDGQDDSTTAPPPAPTETPVETPEPDGVDTPEDEDPAESDDPTASDDDGPLGVGEARVVVLDPGAEPRTELRLAIAASCTEIMTMTTTQEISQTIGGQSIPSAGAIGNVMEMETSATPVDGNYEIRAEVISAVSAPDTPPALAASIDPELAAIVGLTSYATLTDRAVQIPGTSRVEGAEVLGPMAGAVESLNQSQSPLPEEAVGAGARWETTSLLELEGLLVTTTVINELVSIDGTIIELQITGTQEVDPDSRMRIQGLTGEVTQWDIATTGTTIVDLATINPISATLSTEGVQAFDFGPDGLLEQELSTQIETQALPNDGCTGRTVRG